MFLVSTMISAFGQKVMTNKPDVKTFLPYTKGACNPDLIFAVVEIMPNYIGGLQQLENDLNDSLELDKKISGTVFISIYINCQDKAYGFQVLKGISDSTDKKLIGELQKLQNWTSGIHLKKKVDCYKNVGFRIKKGRVTITN